MLAKADSPKLSYIEFTLRKKHSPSYKKQTIQGTNKKNFVENAFTGIKRFRGCPKTSLYL
ncbi:hypothetical protein DQM68_09455 [Leptospira mayottensis]|uniref:Transposase n=1 Tax=Leptospira mayottensis TaxID=1137606 RepID=A0ABN5NWD6_9LEPT|nr:hypothetical protein DQM68_09455 [Leptospira mayottensis]AXR64747.1 hypothetical protein DQM28_11495 [Leptospira mayottensis]AZQ02692.1 hypothetical protein LEP1GSC190_12235 [Leptospira mayottensis 200901116]TGM89583.1 hypothetical protein EHR03_19235 [Leptospira mayottensis]